jgi:hypothetical protein
MKIITMDLSKKLGKEFDKIPWILDKKNNVFYLNTKYSDIAIDFVFS